MIAVIDHDFEEALLENPGDVILRNVYADWLEEHDNMELSRWHREASKQWPVPNLRQWFGEQHSYRGSFIWPYCYLHGEAELLNKDDRFLSDQSIPEQDGEYPVLLHGKCPAWAIIEWYYASRRLGYTKHGKDFLCGRISLVSDVNGLSHARRCEDWR